MSWDWEPGEPREMRHPWWRFVAIIVVTFALAAGILFPLLAYAGILGD